MDQAVKIIQDRVNRLGVAEPEIQRQGEDKISVQLPGIDNPEQALQVIGKTAVLEFFDVKDFGTRLRHRGRGPQGRRASTSADQLPAGTEIIHWPADGRQHRVRPVVRRHDARRAVTGAMLEGRQLGYDQNNQPKVDMQFNDEGATAFADITKKLAETAQITGEDQLLAIVLDGEVESAPRVQERDPGRQRRDHRQVHPGRGQGPGAGAATPVALPVELHPVSQNSIGATLGKSALNQALLAGAIGLLLVMVFMIAYYRLLGVVASIALIIYGVLFIGILNAIGVTMTLPGIAGMILTLGMAVDANVLIFARMRDEVAAGKTIGAATSAGFKKAFRAVFDCNMTTIITAIILFWAASGRHQGLRAHARHRGRALHVHGRAGDPVHAQPAERLEAVPQHRRLLGLHVAGTEEGWKIYPFMRYVVVPEHARRGHRLRGHHHLRLGLDFGIDFKGGTRMEVGLEQEATVDEVRDSGHDARASRTRWSRRSPGASGTHALHDHRPEETLRRSRPGQAGAGRALDSKYGTWPTRPATETGRGQLRRGDHQPGLHRLRHRHPRDHRYLTFRFEFKFAIPAIVALLHDVGLTLGIYAASNRLVTTATVAAILTILGYSVHDTIIVFDRIRENTLLMKKETYGEMVDLSIRQTLIRSINTTIALLLPLLAILIFGGPTLKDFAFALTIGVLTGTYSSFFVASPLVVLWKEREPRYRKRLALAGAGGRRDRGRWTMRPRTRSARAAAQTPSKTAAEASSIGASPAEAGAVLRRSPKKGKTAPNGRPESEPAGRVRGPTSRRRRMLWLTVVRVSGT